MAVIESERPERPESYGDTSKSPMSATGKDSSSSSKSKSQSPMSATGEDSSSSSKSPMPAAGEDSSSSSSKSPMSAAGEDSSSSSKSKPISFDGVYEEDGVLIFDDCDITSDVDIDDILDYVLRTYPKKEPSSDDDDDGDDDDDDDDDIWDPDRRRMTVEERAAYAKQVRDSDGFDVDPPPAGARPCGPIYPISDIDNVCRKFTNFAIENRESLKERNLKLKQIIKWNQEIGSPLHYYITFKAEDLDTGEVETYQALVERRIPEEESEVTVFRVRPRPDSLTEGPR